MAPDRFRHVALLGAYGTFQFVDGAMRMLLLLSFHLQDFSAIQLGLMFVLYELASTFSVLVAGRIRLVFAPGPALRIGMIVQILALVIITRLDAGWAVVVSMIFVMLLQGLSGVAKDLARVGMRDLNQSFGKDRTGLASAWSRPFFSSRNTYKGMGFFFGSAILGILGFVASILMLAGLLLAMLIVLFLARSEHDSGQRPLRPDRLVSDHGKRLELARLFLVGSRDVWFVVGVPIFLFETLSDGTITGDMDACLRVGLFTASWIVGYSAARSLIACLHPAGKTGASYWHLTVLIILLLVPVLLASGVILLEDNSRLVVWGLIAGLVLFGMSFASVSFNQSVMMGNLTGLGKQGVQEPFYYANGAGRLVGTLLSGIGYQLGGVELCLVTASAMLLISALAAHKHLLE